MSWLAFWILAGPILLAIASTAYSLYLRWRYLDAMLEALKNSRYVHTWGPGLRQRGVVWGPLADSKNRRDGDYAKGFNPHGRAGPRG